MHPHYRIVAGRLWVRVGCPGRGDVTPLPNMPRGNGQRGSLPRPGVPLPSRSHVNVLPVERYAPLIDPSPTSPPQPIDEREVSPASLEEA